LTMIKIAEEQFNIPIEKKSGAKRLDKWRHFMLIAV
jgi:hypothetical protein